MEIKDSVLYKRFPEVYEEFFATHDLVLSSCTSYSMYPGMSWRSGAPNITHKLPFRIYIGLRRSGRPGQVSLGSLRSFVPLREKFIVAPNELLRGELSVQHIERHCTEIFGGSDFPGILIDVLQEHVKDHCVNAGMTTLVLAALGLFAERWTPSDLERMTTLSAIDFADVKNSCASLYRVLHADVMRYDTDVLSLSAFGGQSFSAIVSSDFPIVYCTEERGGSVTKPLENLFPMDVIGHSDRLRDLRWWGFRLNEVSGARGEFPLDIAIINPTPGYQEYISMSEHIDRSIIPAFDDLAVFSRQMAQRANISGNRLPVFVKESKRPGVFWGTYARAGTVVSMNFIRSLVNLYEHPHVPLVIQSFFEAVSSSVALNLSFIEGQSLRIQRLINKIAAKAESVGVPIGLRSFAIGKMDASIIVYSAKGTFRDEILELVDAAGSGRRRVSLDYASWENGYGSGGIHVDQYRENGIISPIVKECKYVLTYRDSDGAISERFIKDVQESTRHFDLLVDRTSDELFIGGRSCTSNDLPTQKATVQVLDFLFNHLGQSIPSDQLPPSAYARYRNEFQGKIISPLNRSLRKRVKKELGLNIHGKLTSFSITWNPGKLRIGILKPL